MTDLREYENDGIIKTQYRLKAPMVRTTSLLSVQAPEIKKPMSKRKRPSSGRSRGSGQAKGSRRNSVDRSGASTPDPEAEHSSSIEDDDDDSSLKESIDAATLEKVFQPLKDLQKECVQQMRAIRSDLRRHYSSHQDDIATLQFKDWLLLLLFVITQGFFHWYYKRWPVLHCRDTINSFLHPWERIGRERKVPSLTLPLGVFCQIFASFEKVLVCN